MKCKAAQGSLTAYIDGELDKQTADVVKTHLNLCSTCSLEYDRMKKTLAATRAWEARPLPEGLAATVQERAERGEKPRRVSVWPGGVVPSLDLLARPAWQLAVVCLVLVIGVALGHFLWPRQAQRDDVGGVGLVEKNGAREGALEMLATLQKLKLVLAMRDGTQRVIAEHSAMQRRLAEAIDPELAAQVAAYHEAEALIAEGRLDEADAILGDLESADPPFVLAPYVRITRLAAQLLPAARPRGSGVYAELLMPEVIASPERLYEAIAKHSTRFAHVYIEALDEGLEPFDRIRFPNLLRHIPEAPGW